MKLFVQDGTSPPLDAARANFAGTARTFGRAGKTLTNNGCGMSVQGTKMVTGQLDMDRQATSNR